MTISSITGNSNSDFDTNSNLEQLYSSKLAEFFKHENYPVHRQEPGSEKEWEAAFAYYESVGIPSNASDTEKTTLTSLQSQLKQLQSEIDAIKSNNPNYATSADYLAKVETMQSIAKQMSSLIESIEVRGLSNNHINNIVVANTARLNGLEAVIEMAVGEAKNTKIISDAEIERADANKSREKENAEDIQEDALSESEKEQRTLLREIIKEAKENGLTEQHPDKIV